MTVKLSDYLRAFCELGADESITETECMEHAKLVAADRERATRRRADNSLTMGEDDADEETWPPPPRFVDCTCDHDPGLHGWVHCDVPDCPCEGAWEE